MGAKIKTSEVLNENIMSLLIVPKVQPVVHSSLELPLMLLPLCHMCQQKSCREAQALQHERLHGLPLSLGFVLHDTSDDS